MVPTFTIASQHYKRNPYPVLAEMVRSGPLVRVKYPVIGTFLAATTYEAVQDLLRSRETFVRDPRTAGLKKGANLPWWLPRTVRSIAGGMINRDEPDHRRLRALVEQAFLRRNIDHLRPRLVEMTDAMLDALEDQYRRAGQPVDLVAGLARPLPLAAICELLGLPESDRLMFTRQAEVMAAGTSVFNLIWLLRSVGKVSDYMRQRIEVVRRRPEEGLITALVNSEQDGDRLDDEEMVAMFLLLLFAGHVTTVHLIGAGVYTLLTHPDQMRLLAADWSLLEAPWTSCCGTFRRCRTPSR